MTDLFENPLGLDGFEFVEFSAPEKGLLEPVFETMGFTRIAQHRSKDVHLWRQGEINLIANYEPRSPAAFFTAEHGPSACGMAFRVKDAAKAYAEALERGAETGRKQDRRDGTAHPCDQGHRRRVHLSGRSLCDA